MSKQIFLSGAISGVNPEYYHGWRNYMVEKLRDDFKVIDPTNFDFEEDDEAMKTDLWGVRNSDIIVVNFNYNPRSIGTAMEIAEAVHWGIPVIGHVSRFLASEYNEYGLHPWLRMSCTKLFVTQPKAYTGYEYLDDMISYLRRNYLWT